MEIVYDEEQLERYLKQALATSGEHPILIDKFLDDATEVDVDAVGDGEQVIVGGIMEHIERAGIHSGDSACSLPPRTLDDQVCEEIRRQVRQLAIALNVLGLMNVQFAVKDRDVYILEVNPRASRTVPFVSKSIGVPLAKIAARIMVGRKLAELGLTAERRPKHISVKESVLPFNKFAGVDTLLGPEMKSTGEVMGIDSAFSKAFAKAQMASGMRLPLEGRVFVSVPDEHREEAARIGGMLLELGFELLASGGTATFFEAKNVPVGVVDEIEEALRMGSIAMVINTHANTSYQKDEYLLRRNTLDNRVPYFTTMAGAQAAVEAIGFLRASEITVRPLQDYVKKSG